MANTAFATGDALTQKIWSAFLCKEAEKDMYLSKFIGEGADNIIQLKNDLTKKKGDKVTVGLRMRMTGAGQTSATTGITLEGNEEALTFYDFSVTLAEYGHAVRAGSKLDLQRPAFDLRSEMKDALKEWLPDKLEKLLIAALVASPTTNRKIDVSGSGGTQLTVANIQKAKRKAQLATPKVRPVNVEGGEYYVMLVHPYSTKSLKADSDWKNAQLYANIRGMKNPIFNGALGLIDGVVVHEYDRSNLLATGSTALNLLLGAQAAVLGYAQYPSWLEKMFDYHRIPGVATDMVLAHGKSVFNTEDFGTIMLITNYVAD